MKVKTSEKVVYFMPLLNDSEELNSCLLPLTRKNSAFVGQTNELRISFSREPDTEFFKLEQEDYKVFFSFCGVERKAKTYVHRGEAICFKDVFGIDFISSGYANGIRGSAILRSNKDDAVKFEVKTTNLKCRLSQQKTIEFVSRKTEEIIFCLSAPFLEDGGGNLSNEVTYDLQIIDISTAIISIRWNSQWCTNRERVLPVSIEWQLAVPKLTNISTYSKIGHDLVATTLHKVGGTPQEENEMFLKIKVPNLENDEVVETASLILTQSDVFSADRNIYNISLFQIDSLPSANDGILICSTPLHHRWSMVNGDDPTYCFDITELIKQSDRDKVSEIFLKIKLERRAKGYENYVVLHGATSNILLAPKMKFLFRKKKELVTNNPFQKGDLVCIKKGSHYKTGGCVPEWLRMQRWYIDQVFDDYVVIKSNEFGIIFDLPPINKKFVILLEHRM